MEEIAAPSLDGGGCGLYLESPDPAEAGVASDSDDLVNEFLVESHENLDQLDGDLVALEQDPSDSETLARIFRCIHTVKGTCGFFGFSKLETLTHAAEGLLGRLRDGESRLTPEITSALLAALDAVREILSHIETQRDEGPGDYHLLTDALTRLSQSDAQPSSASEGMESELPRFGELLVQTGRVKPEELARALQAQESGDGRFLGEILVEAGALRPQEVADALRLQEESRASAIWDNTIRIEIRLIDRLSELVTELAMTHSQLLQLAASREDMALLAATTRLSRITTELREGVMKTRMQPIGSIWNKLPRLARDLAVTCRKQVRLEMAGDQICLGRGVLEAIKDPLLHLVRNAVDHGIESPEERIRRGKPAEGRILLRARCEQSQVQIELSDDGAGIDPDRIREKAVRCGLITPEQARTLQEPQLVSLIFYPGFSTSEQVTHISGRGVGMDVVKNNIEKIGGSIEVESRPGDGTTIRLRVPMSLSEPGLPAGVGSSRARG
jgi:two-component system, chemotaxis family, sensor kinase CheA